MSSEKLSSFWVISEVILYPLYMCMQEKNMKITEADTICAVKSAFCWVKQCFQVQQ